MAFKYITANPGLLNGKPCIKGTRVSVELILDWLANGSTIEQIAQEFPTLKPDAIKEAILYAAELSRNELVIELQPV